ncbi:nucleolar protein dao-5 isoform X1 [Amyelois transitella]|uniref:nucleolar protein dao-5 isoform X1 n=1 Tax=Amyelois transitella TaxID=680683 RepID=UPI00299073F7|nr:nucleolar protein dao-5 isoform X1 [Amyelois transitella]
MSQKTSRKAPAPASEDKEKTDSPVKDMKKKMAANAEKEKEKAVAEKSDNQTEKQDKNAKQPEKTAEKAPEKKEEKKVEKNDKVEKDKKNEKPAEKKPEADKPKEDKMDKNKKQNGHNGTENGAAALNGNGTDAEVNGRVSAESEDELDAHEDDELFPELTYDDSEDSFEPPTPDGVPSRSFTRRSQAKLTRTPETPRPASAKHDAAEDSKEAKVLKMKDDTLATDRKLRSADSPKPESKKDTKDDVKDKKQEAKDKKDDGEKGKESEVEKDKLVVDVVVDVEIEEGGRKPDTNFSKSRVKVSPYRRSVRLADQTNSSVMANYTGNNTTMEMDITETSSFITEDPSLDDSYLSGLRSIRGRRSYKPLKEMNLRNIAGNRSTRSNTSITVPGEQPSRPTGTVVGRKRKPEAGDDVEVATEAGESGGKRARLLGLLRRSVPRAHVARRAAEIVGINTDLPLSAPVSTDTVDPETLKPATVTPSGDRDAKRCVVM